MPEVDLGFPRQWVSFANPEDATEVFKCDLTWLTSRWTCIFGNGCPGVYKTAPDVGCCAHGAHFADDGDHDRVAAAVARLTPDQWEKHGVAADAWTETDADGELKTRAINGACVFHNSRDFAGGYGCALHGLALAEGVEPLTLKPDVCWQLPIRRRFTNIDPGDGDEYTEVEIGEYIRAGWGAGGHDFDWYCTSNTDAHVGTQPVYLSQRAELIALMGAAGYAELEAHCASFEASRSSAVHPATSRN
ncbi:MAG: hypothetical protein ACJ71Z_10520 [Aeromicrobium sp.]